ncbi:MAG: lipoyl protein ligase domain-containing protein [Acidimicrobiales bacterium]
MLERRGAPGTLHGEVPDPLGRRLACVCFPLAPAVVIGSAQPASDFDGERLAAAGMALVRRRSGGGAVLVVPGSQVWLDVFVPDGDVLAQADVGRSFHWLGDAYAAAIAAVLGAPGDRAGVAVNRGPRRATALSRTLCYAGLGAGEVTVAGRKVVGMSQRRERAGAWIHSMALLSDQSDVLPGLLTGSEDHRAAARAALSTAGLSDAEHLVGPLTEEILARLP